MKRKIAEEYEDCLIRKMFVNGANIYLINVNESLYDNQVRIIIMILLRLLCPDDIGIKGSY